MERRLSQGGISVHGVAQIRTVGRGGVVCEGVRVPKGGICCL